MEKQKKVLIAPSVLSADFSRLGEEVVSVTAAGADLIHVDVMDGHFVPNITIGPVVVLGIRKSTSLPLDVHLMIEEPWRYFDEFIKAGSSIITVHSEVCSLDSLRKMRHRADEAGVRFGISINPETSVEVLREEVLKIADMILVMSVHPGFGGQKFISEVLPKIKFVRQRFSGDLEVDGGINRETAPAVISAGANVLVAGSFVFGQKDRQAAIESLRL